MGRPFSSEVAYLPEAISWALRLDLKPLRRVLDGTSARNLCAIGSGGSFSVAAFAAQQNEIRYGRLSRACTPLEYQTLQRPLDETSVMLISAEGKNKDILAAAQSMLVCDHPGLALTLSSSSPLGEFCHETGAATVISFDMPWTKDGYLATNSLVAMMTILARAYATSTSSIDHELQRITSEWVHERRSAMLKQGIVEKLIPRCQPIVLYGGIGRFAAIDIESKFAEAALGSCQVVDYRQFAHGRHLQLSRSGTPPIVIAFISARDATLAEQTLALIPNYVPVLRLWMPDHSQLGEIAGVVDAILLTEAVAIARGVDPGQPDVPKYGRDIYALDIGTLQRPCTSPTSLCLSRKSNGGRASGETLKAIQVGGEKFCDNLAAARIRALVCDFDGTFCDTDRRFEGLDSRLATEIERFLAGGIVIGFATGRGDSLLPDLRNKIEKSLWPKVILGYYSGSFIRRLDEDPVFPEADNRFGALISWLNKNGILYQLEATPKVDCGQLGIRSANRAGVTRAVTAIRHWIQETGATGWRVYCSGHSIDVLTEQTGKQLVVDAVSRFAVATQDTQILRLGDSGDFDGNDFELLDSGLGLSVGSVSPAPDHCWSFLPFDRRGAAGTLFYLSALSAKNGVATFDEDFIRHSRQLLEVRSAALGDNR